MTDQIVALVPVREGSERIKSKNFINFNGGKSLLEIKIQQLKKNKKFSKIYISSDSDRARKIAKEHGVDFLLRDKLMCKKETRWSDVVEYIMDTIPGNPIVTWTLATAPLFSRFDKAIDTFLENVGKYDSLVGVLPKKSFIINEYGQGINFNPGVWHPYSQQLKTHYEVTGSTYIGQKSNMKKWHYWFGINPYLFEVTKIESIDVDTQEDFNLAKRIYDIK